MKTGPKPRTLQQAWEYLLTNSRREGECLLYEKGRPVGIGYRRIRAGQYDWFVHHLAFLMSGKIMSSGHEVRRHTCDRPNCINPDHIISGTHADNVQDKVSRGRVPKGKTHYTRRVIETRAKRDLYFVTMAVFEGD